MENEHGRDWWPQQVARVIDGIGEKEQSRQAAILRMVSSVAAALCVVYTLFYAWIGFEMLLPIIVLTIIGGILWAATIPMMRFGQAIAVSYNAIVTTAVFVMSGWLAGSAPGNHYHLLAAPMLMLTLGVRR